MTHTPIDPTNLPDRPLTQQEIFDVVVAHAATMKRRSEDLDGNCAYRGDNGAKCFIGCLIRDDEYTPYIEREPIEKLRDLGFNIATTSGVSERFLYHLQRIHDRYIPSEWPAKFRAFADKYGLTFHDYTAETAND